MCDQSFHLIFLSSVTFSLHAEVDINDLLNISTFDISGCGPKTQTLYDIWNPTDQPSSECIIQKLINSEKQQLSDYFWSTLNIKYAPKYT